MLSGFICHLTVFNLYIIVCFKFKVLYTNLILGTMKHRVILHHHHHHYHLHPFNNHNNNNNQQQYQHQQTTNHLLPMVAHHMYASFLLFFVAQYKRRISNCHYCCKEFSLLIDSHYNIDHTGGWIWNVFKACLIS